MFVLLIQCCLMSLCLFISGFSTDCEEVCVHKEEEVEQFPVSPEVPVQYSSTSSKDAAYGG